MHAAGRRQVGGSGPAAGGGVAEAGLHDAVLAGVVREHRAPPAGLQGGEAGVDGGRQHVELGVHGDADRLEGALGRMAAGAAGRRGDGVADDLGQLGGGGHGTGGDDRLGDAAGEALVAEGAEQTGQLLLVGVVHDVGGRAGLALVHAHVERGVVPVAEAAVGAVELGAADPQVEEHAAHRCRVRAVARCRPRRRTGCGGGATRSPKGSRRSAAAARASLSWSSPSTRRCSWASSSAEACPPPPTVASTTQPGGTGANSSTMRSTSTGSCRNSEAASPPASLTCSPPGSWCPPGCLPGTDSMGSERRGGLPSRCPGGCRGATPLLASRLSSCSSLSCGGWVGRSPSGARQS